MKIIIVLAVAFLVARALQNLFYCTDMRVKYALTDGVLLMVIVLLANALYNV